MCLALQGPLIEEILMARIAGILRLVCAEASSLFIMVPQSNGSYLEDTYYDSTFGLSNPNGVAVDASGKVFVANFGANNVLEFNGPVSVVADVILKHQPDGCRS